MSVLKEFREFINKGNVVDLAVAVVTEPVAAKRCRAFTSVLAAIALVMMLAAPSPASAQTNPAFVFAKPEEVKVGAPPPPPVEWKSQVKAGMTSTSGNSQTITATAGLSVSRKQAANKFAFDAAVAYGESNIIVPVFGDPVANPTTITSLERRSTTTNDNWLTKARYDRFFTTNNAGYVSGQAGGDRIAGKSLMAGGQIGYSRQLLKNDTHTLVSEIGYDYSNERYVSQPMRTLDPVSIHSARVFVGETLKLSESSALIASVEAFFNLNREGSAINAQTRTPGVDPLHDTRVVGKATMTTTVWKRLSVALGFTLRFDQNPAPRPVPSGSPAGSMYSATTFPFANRTDTLGELALVYTFI